LSRALRGIDASVLAFASIDMSPQSMCVEYVDLFASWLSGAP